MSTGQLLNKYRRIRFMGSIGNGNSSVQDYISEWKSNEIDRVIEEMDRWRTQQQEWQSTKTFQERMMLERNVPSVYLSAIKGNYASEEAKNNRFHKVAQELIDAHFDTLQNKVKERIGDIVDIKRIGGTNDYDMKGSNGESVRVQVVMAGGYNKQRLHTRWIMNKLKK